MTPACTHLRCQLWGGGRGALQAPPAAQAAQPLLHPLADAPWPHVADLSWDIIARFGDASLPRGFFDDFVAVAEEECKHHLLLKARPPGLYSSFWRDTVVPVLS